MDRNSQKPIKQVFMSQEEVDQALRSMEADIRLNTESDLSPHHIDTKLSFFEKHAAYLKSHPKVNPLSYLTNLRTMIKKRP